MTSESNVIKCSAVVPVYNEEESLPVLLEELSSALSQVGKPYEIIFVDDCSDDTSPQILDKYEKEHEGVVRVIRKQQRSGQSEAMRIGIEKSKGELVTTLDADLQNDPADIPRLLAKMNEGGFDCVCGWRKNRGDKWLKAKLSKFGNILQRLFTGLKIHDVSCTLRLYKKDVARKVPLNWEGQHRFIPLSLSLQGFKIGEIESNHRIRKFGYTKYSHKRIFKVMVDFFRILAAKGQK